jgi:cytochrome c556
MELNVMKKITRLFMLVVGLSVSAPLLAADNDPLLKAIKARQGEMQIRSFNLGPLFAMAKGEMEYNADKAAMMAGNLALMLSLNMGEAWPAGSDTDAYSGKTTALPKIWKTYPEIADYGKKYAEAVRELQAVAGNGQDALKSKIGAVGKSCKGCHDEFREKK